MLTRRLTHLLVNQADAEINTDIKLFRKWAFDDIEVNDMSLEDYIAVKPQYATYLPHTQKRYQVRARGSSASSSFS